MSLVEDRWRARQARSEDALTFDTDEIVELCGTPAQGYRADLRTPIEGLLKTAPDGWTHIEETCTSTCGDFIIYAGATSAEGGGFIAVERLGRLAWLLHLSDSEPFVELSCEGKIIHATSEEYPFHWHWKIPIESPEDLTVTAAA
jgi:hypothetical protein